MSVDNALQAAIYTALSGGDYAVYDHVPQETAYPYITFTQHEVVEEDLMSDRLERHFVYISCWSDYRGSRQVNSMLEWIVQQLHRQKLTLSTGSLCELWVSRRRATPDIDGQTYQGNATVTAIVQPA